MLTVAQTLETCVTEKG